MDKEFILNHNKKYFWFSPFQQVFEYPGNIVFGRNVKIGIGTVIRPNVVIYDDVVIGDNCVIDSGVVIGAPGFSTHIIDGKAMRMKNVGGVTIGNNVEIGANSCVDRASLEYHYTVIEDNVFIDNLCHIAHNCVISSNVRIAPLTCVGGSATIGEYTWISMCCAIRDHVRIGKDCFVCMNSIVTEDLQDGTRMNSFSSKKRSDEFGTTPY